MLKQNLILLIFIVISTACSTSQSSPTDLAEQYQVGDSYMRIKLQGTIELAYQKINGIRLTELSGLAWDDDEQLLYAISDQGYLFHLQPFFVKNVLVAVNPVSAYSLRNKRGKRLPSLDAEGLAILKNNNGRTGDTELLISFERRPQIARFRVDGQKLNDYTLPTKLQKINNYYNSNKMLESVTRHPRFGILTAPEWPLKFKQKTYSLKGQHQHTLFALKGNMKWTFPAYSAPNSAIVALETLNDESILILERAFVSFYRPLIISLRQLWLFKNGTTTHQQIAVFDSRQGWYIDNFEGLTHHQGPYFFIVSDDNDSSFQTTLLSYWELVPVKNK
jgi:hypothetical protein